jgi:hypothetical protein
MVVTSIDRIKDVIISVDSARNAQEKDMYMEYERSAKWLSEVATVRLAVEKLINIRISLDSLFMDILSRSFSIGDQEKDVGVLHS